MKLIYIAGPFSAATRVGVESNIAAAQRVGIEVAKLGAMPVVPHANTAHPDYEQVQPYTFWIEGTRDLLMRCDAVLLMPNWKDSSGARGEYDAAVARGMPVHYSVESLSYWLKHLAA